MKRETEDMERQAREAEEERQRHEEEERQRKEAEEQRRIEEEDRLKREDPKHWPAIVFVFLAVFSSALKQNTAATKPRFGS